MAASSHKLFVWDNGRKLKESKGLEVLVTAIAVSADAGVTNTLTIKEGTGGAANTFDFAGKKIGNVAAGSAAGQALVYDQRGANNGVASLDSGGKVPVTELPNSIMEYQGSYDPTGNAGAGVPALANGTGSAGDVYRVSVEGSHNFGAGSKSMIVGDYVIYSGAVWEISHGGADAVISVNGQSGAVDLTADNIDEGTTNKYFNGKYSDDLPEGSTNLYFATGFAAATTDGLAEGTTNKYAPATTDGLTEGTTNKYFNGKYSDDLPEGSTNLYFSGKDTDDLAEGTTNLYFTDQRAIDAVGAGADYAVFTNKEVGAITVKQFVKMTVAGQVTLLTSADSVGDESFFGCVKTASIDADGTGNVYLPEMGARVGGFTGLDVTKRVYAHATTPGSYTQTWPTTGKVIVLGKPISATEIIFLGRFEFAYA